MTTSITRPSRDLRTTTERQGAAMVAVLCKLSLTKGIAK